MEPRRKPLFYRILWIFIGIAIIGSISLLVFNRTPKGVVRFTLPEADARVFIDTSEQRHRDTEKELSFELSTEKKHTVLIAEDKYWPWVKTITPHPETPTTLFPFLIKKNTTGLLIPTGDPEYQTIKATLRNIKPPTNTRRISPSGNVAIWIEDGALKASWLPERKPPEWFCAQNTPCQLTRNIPTGDIIGEINNIDFFKEEDHLLLIGDQNGIYALEIDTRGTQNRQPVYKGGEVRFMKVSATSSRLYLLDGTELVAEIHL